MQYHQFLEISAEEEITIDSAIVFKYVPLAKEFLKNIDGNEKYTFLPRLITTCAQNEDGLWVKNIDADISYFEGKIKNIENIHIIELYAIMHCICNFIAPFHIQEEIEIIEGKDGWLKVVSVSKGQAKLEKLITVLEALKSLVQIKEHEYNELNVKFSTKSYSELRESKDQTREKLYQDLSAALSDETAQMLLDTAITSKSKQAEEYLKYFPFLHLHLDKTNQAPISFTASNIDTMIAHLKIYTQKPISKNLLNKFAAKTIIDYIDVEIKKKKKEKAFCISSDEGEFIYGLFFQFGFLEEKDMTKQQKPRYKAEKLRGLFSHNLDIDLGIQII